MGEKIQSTSQSTGSENQQSTWFVSKPLTTGSDLPTGTVTFLFTDIEGSTPHWEHHPDLMEESLKLHNDILFATIQAHKGAVFKLVGDEFQSAFRTALQALQAAIDVQLALRDANWNELGPIKIRIGLHTGEAHLDDIGDEYAVSPTKNRVGRIRSAAHGGQIILSKETADLCETCLPDGMRLKYLGEFRMKGLTRLEPLYQVIVPGLQEEFPPLATLTAPKNNLPLQMTSFVGREVEIEQVKERLAENRLVTLTGVGGIGKSRLSLRVAEEVLEQYPAGVWYIELAPLSDPSLVVTQVASILGLREEAKVPLEETLIFYLRSRQVLLILDNCEHLLEVCVRLVDRLLHACPQLKVLVSSREPLGVGGETVFRLPSLSFPEVGEVVAPRCLPECDALQLLVERARAVLPDYQVTPKNIDALVRICQRLDGIPLALELAAARLSILSAGQLADKLEDAFRLLTGGSRSALPRHQTLQAVVDWSYNLLSQGECALLRRLSVFAGGCTLEAAETVCAGDGLETGEVLDMLASLVNKSMVLADRRQGEARRYRLYDTVRQYAQKKLYEAQESQTLRDRHLGFYLVLAETAELKLRSTERLEWTRRVKDELDNLRVAMQWAYQGTNKQEYGLRIASALTNRFWHITGLQREGAHWISDGIELLGDNLKSGALLAKALSSLGWESLAVGDAKTGQSAFEKCITVCRSVGTDADEELAHALMKQAYFLIYFFDDFPTAQKLVDESIQVARRLGPSGCWTLGEMLSIKSFMYIYMLGLSDESFEAGEEGYHYAVQSGDRWDASGLWGMGMAYARRGDYDQARHLLEKALTLFTEVDDKMGIAISESFRSWLYHLQGDFWQAFLYMREFQKFQYEIGNQYILGNYLGILGMELVYLGIQLTSTEKVWMLAQAAVLFGAHKKLGSGFFRDHSYMYIGEDYQRAHELLSRELDETILSRSLAEGQAMTIDEVIAFAQSIKEPEGAMRSGYN
jgi:predicted ATPase/class 3 adenylate cyclase